MNSARTITVEFNVDPVQKLVLGVFFGAAIKNLSDLTVAYEDGRVRLVWNGTENGVCCHVKLSARVVFDTKRSDEGVFFTVLRDKLFSYAIRYLTSTTASLSSKSGAPSESILNKIVPTRMEVDDFNGVYTITSLSFGADGVDVVTFTARPALPQSSVAEE